MSRLSEETLAVLASEDQAAVGDTVRGLRDARDLDAVSAVCVSAGESDPVGDRGVTITRWNAMRDATEPAIVSDLPPGCAGTGGMSLQNEKNEDVFSRVDAFPVLAAWGSTAPTNRR